jgi:hypothetical protein
MVIYGYSLFSDKPKGPSPLDIRKFHLCHGAMVAREVAAVLQTSTSLRERKSVPEGFGLDMMGRYILGIH